MNKPFTQTAVAIIALASLLAGCQNLSVTKKSKIVAAPNIGFVSEKYRICRDECPQRTPKTLDDSEPVLPPTATSIAHPEDSRAITSSISQAMSGTGYLAQTRQFVITFKFGKSIPTKEGFKVLSSLLEPAKTAESIAIFGTTDNIGTKKYNDSLAFARAHYVAKWLQKHGVESKISVESKGECCHPMPYLKTEAALIKQRRAEVKVQPSSQEGEN
ncbi:MAG: hypothetical protein COZ20_03845 [Gallionellales bacterium CG_4_10_14_3_um_filter_54_96]|nr:MAG: hypothetical protein COW45_05285 [Gallionellales bacterium CG17_big_fil_post_rev_8_21_14_2_50_54_146]PIX04943.1 MAG: hypothetical protein COZ77_03835 [Gallionellales bacterium CG_4_8_14_3_um_filter_54_18]PIY05155.1 MAG: hypothetical protein COZ20_03845 [Gallionellales bacterium CG_4_10_14_3_um_filter_54_96]